MQDCPTCLAPSKLARSMISGSLCARVDHVEEAGSNHAYTAHQPGSTPEPKMLVARHRLGAVPHCASAHDGAGERGVAGRHV